MRPSSSKTRSVIKLVLVAISVAFILHSCFAWVVWRPQTTFFYPNNSPLSALGGPIAVDANTIVVGASSRLEKNLPNHLLAYVYKQDGIQWQPQIVLQGDDFRDDVTAAALSIDISGNTIALGVIEGTEIEPDKGFIYIFVRQGTSWVKQAKIASPDPKATESFASSIALDSNTLVASGGGKGFSVFVRDSNTNKWSYQSALTLSENDLQSHAGRTCIFGSAVDINGDTVVTGSIDNFMANCAHVFVRDPSTQTWRHQAQLRPQANSPARNGFGRSVAIDKDTIGSMSLLR